MTLYVIMNIMPNKMHVVASLHKTLESAEKHCRKLQFPGSINQYYVTTMKTVD